MAADWTYTDDPADPCVYCVQWRPPGGLAEDDPDADPNFVEWEPYMPDGSVPPRVYRDACLHHERMIAEWEAEHEDDPT